MRFLVLGIRTILGSITAALHIFLIYVDGFVDFGGQGHVISRTIVMLAYIENDRSKIDSQVQKLGVVHLEQHASNLASKLGLLLVNPRVEGLSEHLLLLSWV